MVEDEVREAFASHANAHRDAVGKPRFSALELDFPVFHLVGHVAIVGCDDVMDFRFQAHGEIIPLLI